MHSIECRAPSIGAHCARKRDLGVEAALVTGTGRNQTTKEGLRKDLGSILSAFSPRSKERPEEMAGEGEIDLLIATDCISEGQNLQDCDWLVNYDIHWNPVRIIQRFGRIDRIGSPNQSIQLVNFWPNMELEEYINLEQRVSGKMVLLDVSATGEENLIARDSGDQMNDLEYRRNQLLKLQEAVIDLEDLSSGVSIADLIRTMQHGAAVFRKDGVRLTVVMANRHALEEQTGADLIYRNESFGSFVFVQYKAMEHEADRAVFRLPNEQLAKELARMTALSKQLDDCEPEFAIGGFRLMANPFFLKLCPRLTFDPDDTGLTKGMYIPLEYWRRLETDPCIEGARGGRGITYENVGRYFANTDFVSLVARGWVGTAGMQTQILDEVIREAVASGRTVTIAVKEQLPRPPDDDDAEDEEPTEGL